MNAIIFLLLPPYVLDLMHKTDTISIDIYRLENGTFHYEFEAADSFFSVFSQEHFSKPQVSVHVELNRTDSMITALLNLTGSLQLTCDRSLEVFEWPLNLNERLLFKFGEEEKELTDELSVITGNTQKLNLSQAVYDFVALSLPLKKLHPKYRETENDTGDEQGLLVYSTAASEPEETETSDPRWQALAALKTKS